MKKFILASAIMFSLFAVSYGVASAVNANGVTAKAECSDATCN